MIEWRDTNLTDVGVGEVHRPSQQRPDDPRLVSFGTQVSCGAVEGQGGWVRECDIDYAPFRRLESRHIWVARAFEKSTAEVVSRFIL